MQIRISISQQFCNLFNPDSKLFIGHSDTETCIEIFKRCSGVVDKYEVNIIPREGEYIETDVAEPLGNLLYDINEEGSSAEVVKVVHDLLHGEVYLEVEPDIRINFEIKGMIKSEEIKSEMDRITVHHIVSNYKKLRKSFQ